MKKQKDIVADLLKMEFDTWHKIETLKKVGIHIELFNNFTLIDIAFDIVGFPENSEKFDRMKLYNLAIEADRSNIPLLIKRLYNELDSLILQKPALFSRPAPKS